MKLGDILNKARAGEALDRGELVFLLSFPPTSREAMATMAEGAVLSRELSAGVAEVHGQLALNLAPCPVDCKFCSFAVRNDVFREAKEIGPERAVQLAKEFETNERCSAVYLMSTANYPFGKFVEIAAEVRRSIHPEVVLVANVGDQSLANAKRLRDAGVDAVYHAVRLGEGVDTKAPVEQRVASIRHFQEAGLRVGTCVEPIGPEHPGELIADRILLAGSLGPAYSGAARRIVIPNTELAEFGMISELRMAQIVAITRLGTPRTVRGTCTHEPCVIGAAAGANLLWAEFGANPRDVKERTEEGRGHSVHHCAAFFEEAEWQVLRQPSRFFAVRGS